MSSTLLPVSAGLGAAIAVLALAAAAASYLGRLGHAGAVVLAVARAVAQLAAVSLLLVGVVRVGWLTAVFVVVMFTTATVTAGRRIGDRRSLGRELLAAAVPLGAAVVPVIATLIVSGVLPAEPLAVIPVSGILIGGAMTATVLAGRRARDDLRLRRGEVEAALSVGLMRRDAAWEVVRPAAAEALIPALDQTRTVGLVTLPGAFVGMLIGGASPVAAGVVQLFVLVGLLAVEAVAVVVTAELVARGVLGEIQDSW